MGLSAADPSSGASALQVSSLWVSGVGTSGGGGGSVPPLLICGDMALPQWPLGHLSDPSPWAEDPLPPESLGPTLLSLLWRGQQE